MTTTTTTHLIDSYAPYLVPGFDNKFTNGDFITNTLTKGHHSVGRRLDACDDDEDCSKLKKAGQTGCDAASTILNMFWFNNLYLHADVVTFIEGIATTILICTLFHALCMILRLVSAFFMFKAQKVPHNGDAGANGGVPAAVVPAQQVIVVQEAK